MIEYIIGSFVDAVRYYVRWSDKIEMLHRVKTWICCRCYGILIIIDLWLKGTRIKNVREDVLENKLGITDSTELARAEEYKLSIFHLPLAYNNQG